VFPVWWMRDDVSSAQSRSFATWRQSHRSSAPVNRRSGSRGLVTRSAARQYHRCRTTERGLWRVEIQTRRQRGAGHSSAVVCRIARCVVLQHRTAYRSGIQFLAVAQRHTFDAAAVIFRRLRDAHRSSHLAQSPGPSPCRQRPAIRMHLDDFGENESSSRTPCYIEGHYPGTMTGNVRLAHRRNTCFAVRRCPTPRLPNARIIRIGVRPTRKSDCHRCKRIAIGAKL
jgi:hypothetical protein